MTNISISFWSARKLEKKHSLQFPTVISGALEGSHNVGATGDGENTVPLTSTKPYISGVASCFQQGKHNLVDYQRGFDPGDTDEHER